MQQAIRQRIHTLVDSIEDETKLQLLMEDVETYIAETEDDLTAEEINEIDESIAEIDRGEVVDWEEIKNTLKQWRER